jgi:hypothetical protein
MKRRSILIRAAGLGLACGVPAALLARSERTGSRFVDLSLASRSAGLV